MNELPKNEQHYVEEIMASIRAEIRSELTKEPQQHLSLKKHPSSLTGDKVSPVIYSEELNFLNSNWRDWLNIPKISSHRKFIGSFVVRFKRYLIDTVWTYLLKDYLERERTFQMNLVRFLNNTARYIDSRDADIFWQVIKKIDHDIQGVEEKAEHLSDEALASVRDMELNLARSEADIRSDRQSLEQRYLMLENQVEKLEKMLFSIERLISRASKNPETSQQEPEQVDKLHVSFPDGTKYLLLENRYRGSEEEIKQRFADYLQFFKGQNNVLDIGCGRGEFLEVLRGNGISSYGIDINQAMIESCEEKGLRVLKADCFSFLDSLPNNSLGGVFAAQVVEHFTIKQLEQFAKLLCQKLSPGSPLILETINPSSVSALSTNFFRDPTHIWPLHPDTLCFILNSSGLAVTNVFYRSPYPKEALLSPCPDETWLPTRFRELIRRLNQNTEQLNRLLYGFQDYAVLGQKPAC